MNSLRIPPRSSLCTLALSLALPGCQPGSLSLGEGGSDGTASDGTTETDGTPVAEGEVRWVTYRDDIQGIDIAAAPDGSIYVVGLSGYTPQGDGGIYDDSWLAKFDADGGLQWEIFAPQQPDDFVYPVAIATSAAGELYLATIDYDVTADGDNRVIKYDAQGNELWSQPVPGRLRDVVAPPGGGAIAVGAQDTRLWVQQLDADGNLGWSRVFDNPIEAYSEVTSVALTNDGGVVLGARVGLETASSRSRTWAAAIELADGRDRWQTALSEGVITDRIAGVGVTADGTALFAGVSDGSWVKAVGSDGVPQWTWPNDVVEGTASLAVFPDGEFALGDGLYLDVDDPDACFDPPGPCPAVMRVQQLRPDRTPRWHFESSECGAALVVTPAIDGGLLSLAACNVNPSVLRVGLFRFEAPDT